MGSFWSRIRGKPRLQPQVVVKIWKRLAWRRHDVFEQMMISMCKRDIKMAEVLNSVSSRAETKEEAQFLLRMLATRIADWLHGIIEEGTIMLLEELRLSCFLLGQQHAGFTSDVPFEDVWWRIFSEEWASAMNPLTPEESVSLRAMVEYMVENMRSGYDQAWDGMHSK